MNRAKINLVPCERPGEGGGGLLGLIFAGYVLLASGSPYPIIYSVQTFNGLKVKIVFKGVYSTTITVLGFDPMTPRPHAS